MAYCTATIPAFDPLNSKLLSLKRVQ
jgi:hypothetical protein